MESLPKVRVRVVAWMTVASCTVLTALSLSLLLLCLSHHGIHVFDYWREDTVISLVFSVVGAVIVSRRPENFVGWIFCALALSVGLDHLVGEYATYALLASPGNLPAGEAAAWVRSWIWVIYLGLFVFLGLLFPDGKLPGPRWRPFAWLSLSIVVFGAVAVAFSPGPVDGLGPIRNPLGVPGVPNFVWVVNWLVLVPTLVAAASLLLRLQHSVGEERQQLKWFAYAAVLASGGAVLAYPLSGAGGDWWWVRWAGYLVFMVGITGLPIAVAIAILRYRLYDIDLLINKTLVYGTLTVSLATAYFGSILSLQYVLRTVTGEKSQLAVVASTLAIAVLFGPMRRRIQHFIDQRFYRSKYDARKTLEAFSVRLRDESDLDALGGGLVSIVRETVQPFEVSLWLRPSKDKK